jgi:oxygen-dependent protoporphyrinogen oxidase
LSELFDAMISRIMQSAEVRLNARVERIDQNQGGTGYSVSIAGSSPEKFDAVLLAVPAYRAASFVESFDKTLAEELNGIEYASSAIVVSGHRLADIRHPLDAAGLVIPAIENRKILAVSFASRKFAGRAPEGHVLLRTFVGGAMQPELLDQSDDELRSMVRRELADIFGVSGSEDFALVARYIRAMPQYHVGHLDRVARMTSACRRHSHLELAGNYFHGVGIPDCIQSGEQAAERILA